MTEHLPVLSFSHTRFDNIKDKFKEKTIPIYVAFPSTIGDLTLNMLGDRFSLSIDGAIKVLLNKDKNENVDSNIISTTEQVIIFIVNVKKATLYNPFYVNLNSEAQDIQYDEETMSFLVDMNIILPSKLQKNTVDLEYYKYTMIDDNIEYEKIIL